MLKVVAPRQSKAFKCDPFRTYSAFLNHNHLCISEPTTVLPTGQPDYPRQQQQHELALTLLWQHRNFHLIFDSRIQFWLNSMLNTRSSSSRAANRSKTLSKSCCASIRISSVI